MDAVFTLLVLAFVGFLVWQFIASRRAVATTVVQSPHPPQQVTQIVNGAFGGVRSTLWVRASGPGAVNMRRKGINGGITMSIDIEPLPGGGSRIDMWTSAADERLLFFVNFAGSVNSRKRAIERAVTT